MTRSLFGKVFKNVGLTKIVDASIMDTKSQRGESYAATAPFHLVLIPTLAVNKKPSTVHIMGQHKFGDNQIYFQNFGKNQV